MPSRTRAYRLRLPGPTTVPERVRAALAAPMLNHRGPEFREVLEEVESHLKGIMGTSNPVLFFASSGTGLMEASLVNVMRPGDKALFLLNGQFAERFASIAESFGIPHDIIEVPWGGVVDGQSLAARLAQEDYRAVIAIHNESSTGAVENLAELGNVIRHHSALFIVDTVSGLGGIDVRQDAWGIDILLSASQKALMCPPGIGIVSVSDKAWRALESEERKSFYWDFCKARENAAHGQTAFTPPVSLMNGLREALRMIDEEGLPDVLARHQRLSEALKTGGAALDLTVFTQSPIVSNTVTVFNVPAGLNASAIVSTMYSKYGTVIAGARNRLNGTVFRFGTMGSISEADIVLDLLHLEGTLEDLQIPVTPGAAVAAANAYLRAH